MNSMISGRQESKRKSVPPRTVAFIHLRVLGFWINSEIWVTIRISYILIAIVVAVAVT